MYNMNGTEIWLVGIVITVVFSIISWLLNRAITNNDASIIELKRSIEDRRTVVDKALRELEDKVDNHHTENRDRLYNNHVDMLNKLNEVSLKLEKFNTK